MIEAFKDRELIILAAAAEAVRRNDPLQKGEVVATIDDKRLFILRDTRTDGTALVSHRSSRGRLITRIRSSDALFSPNTASAIALRMIILGEQPKHFLQS